jgi:integrase
VKGHIRERSPGRWAIVLDVRDATTGKRKRRWHSFTGTKREAQNECARLICELQGGVYLEPNKTTLAQFLNRWLEHMGAQVSPRTLERYSEIAMNNIIPPLGSVVITKLTPIQVSTAYAKALATGRRDGTGGLSPRTVHHMHRVLKQAMSQAVRWQIIGRNPLDAIDPPRVERRRLDTYDVAQTVELLDVGRGTSMFVPILLAALCGMRRGEIAALRWRSVDLMTGQIAVVESCEQMNGSIRYKEPKNGRARTVALSATVAEELRAHRVAQARELLKLGVRPADDGFVATLADGRSLQPTWITHEWVRLIQAIPYLPRLRFHDLRHAHATHLLASGVHPKVASERLGHSNVGITLDLYSHVMPGMQEDAAARVDDALRIAMAKRSPRTIG